MNLEITKYETQLASWPTEGKTILANFDHNSIVVYQAYRPEIGLFAAKNGRFGDGFKMTRMSWIKPNFLWMMYRCGWATKQGQEVVLAIRISRDAFDYFLCIAVQSSFKPNLHDSREAWQQALADSDVRLQWDPDHEPNGTKSDRKAIQIGLKDSSLEKYVNESIIEIQDITKFVIEQRQHSTADQYSNLIMPLEKAYPVATPSTARNLCLD